jgi:ubiquinone/menaquinone biosynthesis C-methylase UbiE
MKVEELATCFQNVGFKDVQYQRFMGGVVAIHWGSK